MWHEQSGHKSRWHLIALSTRIQSKFPSDVIEEIYSFLTPYATSSHESTIFNYFGYNGNKWQPIGNRQDTSIWQIECEQYLKGLRLFPPHRSNNPEVWFYGGDKRIFFRQGTKFLDEMREDQSRFKEQYLVVGNSLRILRIEDHSIDGRYLRNTDVTQNTIRRKTTENVLDMKITLLFASDMLVDVEGVALENFFIPDEKKYRYIFVLRKLGSLNDVFVCLLSFLTFNKAYSALTSGVIKTAWLVKAILLHNERCDNDERIGIYDTVRKTRYAPCPMSVCWGYESPLQRDVVLSTRGIRIKLVDFNKERNVVGAPLPDIDSKRDTQ